MESARTLAVAVGAAATVRPGEVEQRKLWPPQQKGYHSHQGSRGFPGKAEAEDREHLLEGNVLGLRGLLHSLAGDPPKGWCHREVRALPSP